MLICLKLGKVRELVVEINKEFGVTPLFEQKSFYNEIIIDIPYIQFVYTPSNWNSRRNLSKKNLLRSKPNGNHETRQAAECVVGTYEH